MKIGIVIFDGSEELGAIAYTVIDHLSREKDARVRVSWERGEGVELDER
jgi:hypothetical protein